MSLGVKELNKSVLSPHNLNSTRIYGYNSLLDPALKSAQRCNCLNFLL